MARKTEDELLSYARATVQILQRSIELYDRGETVFYRVMAVELRLLLCDTTRRHDRLYDLSLVPVLWPDLVLPAWKESQPNVSSGPHLPLDGWLAQEVNIAPEWTGSLRQVIRQVCEQDGGAHVDRRASSGFPAGSDASGCIRQIAGTLILALEPLLPPP